MFFKSLAHTETLVNVNHAHTISSSSKPMWECPECKQDLVQSNHLAGCPAIKTQEDVKLSNPKDIIGSDKVPLGLVPGTTKVYLAIGHLEGMLKYGLVNWREAGVRASIYLDALDRHIEKYKNGEWEDQTTKVPHLANALACISIIVDAYECGKLVDDRPKQAPVSEVIDKFSEKVKHLKELFKDYKPHHYLHEKE
jgi:hypothetical protein